jgi:hypothetical protein
VLTYFLSAASAAAVLQTEVGRVALVDQWERVAAAFGHQVDDRQYAMLQAASRHGALYATLSALGLGPLLSVSAASVIRLTFRGPAAPETTFRQTLAVVSHAGVILAVRQVVAAPVVYARETLANPLTLRPLTSSVDDGSILAIASGAVDLFVVWWIIVVAVGISVLYRRRATPLVATFLAAYAVFAVIVGLVAAFAGGVA